MPYSCEFCSRLFKGEKWLINHIATTHAILTQSPHLSRIHLPNSANALDSSFYSSYTTNNNKNSNEPKSKLKNQCTKCKKFYFRKHNCKKNNKNLDRCDAFNFSDSFFSEDSENYTSDPNLLYDNNNYLAWLDKLALFAQQNSSKFKILHININSIFCKFSYLDKLLRKNIFDIVLVQESKLGSEIPSSFVENEIYTLLRRDRAAGGGSVAEVYLCI